MPFSESNLRKLCDDLLKDTKNLPKLPTILELFEKNIDHCVNVVSLVESIFFHFNQSIPYFESKVTKIENSRDKAVIIEKNKESKIKKKVQWMQNQCTRFENVLLTALLTNPTQGHFSRSFPTLVNLALHKKGMKSSMVCSVINLKSLKIAAVVMFRSNLNNGMKQLFVVHLQGENNATQKHKGSPFNTQSLRAFSWACHESRFNLYSNVIVPILKQKYNDSNDPEFTKDAYYANFCDNVLDILYRTKAILSTQVLVHFLSLFALLRALKENTINIRERVYITHIGANGIYEKISNRKKILSECWLGYLSQKNLPLETYYKILSNKFDERIIRTFFDTKTALFLSDFLTNSYKIGGEIALLSLKALFVLINDYNLDFGEFYTYLYNQLTFGIYKSKNLSQLYELLSLFLLQNKGYLPEYLIAAFIKKLARHCLFIHTHGIILNASLISQMLAKYPAMRFLVDQSKKGTAGLIESIRVNQQQKQHTLQSPTSEGSNDANDDNKDNTENNAQKSKSVESDNDTDTSSNTDKGEQKDQNQSDESEDEEKYVTDEKKVDDDNDEDKNENEEQENEHDNDANAVDTPDQDNQFFGLDEKMKCDPFILDCQDPKLCKATQSSLWELKALWQHYEYRIAGHCHETIVHFKSDKYKPLPLSKAHMFTYRKLLNYYFNREQKVRQDWKQKKKKRGKRKKLTPRKMKMISQKTRVTVTTKMFMPSASIEVTIYFQKIVCFEMHGFFEILNFFLSYFWINMILL
ncbi:hypothetical protein RFI_00482 [Reticulomyxa filosa]|uniref:CCAAT-binding factor domain-containing protein n=1 Tax=Reticulomyxa filosa TaxID=46433 RepID=X6PEV8_RETFI|nr:hypothetical protein RFI_00482 [Reticulomyxa filosa]|eukprot:ETO36579.1 hypothetical protein RFI_00482 [Reticulomyxa filosa]